MPQRDLTLFFVWCWLTLTERLRRIAARKRAWRKAHPERVNQIDAQNRARNGVKRAARAAEWERENRTKRTLQMRDWRRKNPDKAREIHLRWVRKQFQEKTEYAIRQTLRARIGMALKAQASQKVTSTSDLLGCSVGEFKIYLADKFRPGMSWENHGVVWEIDHIKPCAKFDLASPEQQKACFHYKNHQPLFRAENRKKGDSFDGV